MLIIFGVLLNTSLLSQVRSEFSGGGGFSYAESKRDSAGFFGFTFTANNRIELYRPNKNLAFTGNLGLNYIAGVRKVYGYGGQLSLGIDLFRGAERFPLTVNYSYGYNFLNYNQRGKGFLMDFSGLNFHRIVFSELVNAEEYGYSYKTVGLGLMLEYSTNSIDQQFYLIGLIATAPYDGWFGKR